MAMPTANDPLVEAKAASDKLLIDEPKLLTSYNTKALVQVKSKDFAGAVGTLKTAVAKFGALDFEPLIDDPDYAEFVKTKEFSDLRKWTAERVK